MLGGRAHAPRCRRVGTAAGRAHRRRRDRSTRWRDRPPAPPPAARAPSAPGAHCPRGSRGRDAPGARASTPARPRRDHRRPRRPRSRGSSLRRPPPRRSGSSRCPARRRPGGRDPGRARRPRGRRAARRARPRARRRGRRSCSTICAPTVVRPSARWGGSSSPGSRCWYRDCPRPRKRPALPPSSNFHTVRFYFTPPFQEDRSLDGAGDDDRRNPFSNTRERGRPGLTAAR